MPLLNQTFLRCKQTRDFIFFTFVIFLVINIILLIQVQTSFEFQSHFSFVQPRTGNLDLNTDEATTIPERSNDFQIRLQVSTSHHSRAQSQSFQKVEHPSVGRYPHEYIMLDCETWCRRGEHMNPPYNLTAVLLVRIYRHDLAGLSTREMLQWLFYLRYAGVEHVYVYDAYVTKNESQYDIITPLVQSGYATYVDWSEHNPYTMEGTQVAAYQDCVSKYGHETIWQISIDMDEYPFSPRDLEQNFLKRFLRKYSAKYPHVSQISLQNFLFLSKPLDHLTNPIFIDRIRRRTRFPANGLVKPVYKTRDISRAHVHHHDMRSGTLGKCDPLEMRTNHYWGARLQKWGEDTPKVLNMTEPDFSIKPIVEKIKKCAKCFGEDMLYVRRWN